MTTQFPHVHPPQHQTLPCSFVVPPAVGRAGKRRTRIFLLSIGIVEIALTLAQLAYSRQTRNTLERSNGIERKISAIRSAYAAFNRGDFDATVAVLDPEIQWTEPATFPGGGTYHGREAVKGYLSQSRSRWAQGSSKPVRFIVSGNRIVVFVFVHFRAKGSSQWNEAKIADVYTIRRGKIVQMNAFAHRDQALHWVAAKSP